MIKGGVWKNTEDEILKVAVMKYGKNQWSRISSLLVRKSAKQCKARWYEWLDPSIKKTEWTREEEEKLLHLAKILPTQWRTIAPIIGRTASQCLEHYEKLLDAAQHRDGDEDADDPRRLRPGEIDPNPEAKPARPDPIDMDEDEKEMLSEARARLANTKGKKAKRKAREKQLEEARRLAALQKRRELKAAGIEIKRYRKKRRNVIDYNEEIPFEKVPAAGFFDVTEERKKTLHMRNNPKFLNVDIQEIDEKRRDLEEERERKKDAKRQKLYRETALPDALLKINALNDPEQIRKRSKLLLPAPQVTDMELEDIAKLGSGAMLPPQSSGPTKTLLSRYETPSRTPSRTPARTELTRDTILEETQNIIALTTQQTPLLGGENATITKSDFKRLHREQTPGMTPSTPGPGGQLVRRTPGMTPGGPGTGGRTPVRPGSSVRGTPGTTPIRDAIGINQLKVGMSAEQAIQATSIRSLKRKRSSHAAKLRSRFANLPEPQMEYSLVLPDLPKDDDLKKAVVLEEDAEDTLTRRSAEALAEREAKFRRRSQVFQSGLPRPIALNTMTQTNGIEREVHQEVLNLLYYDEAMNPVVQENGKKRKVVKLREYTDNQLENARALVQIELSSRPDHTDEELVVAMLGQNIALETGLVFVPSIKKYALRSECTDDQKLEAFKEEFKLLRSQLTDEANAARKLEKKVSILLGGYNMRANKQINQLASSGAAIAEADTNLMCFAFLQEREEKALPQRMAYSKSVLDELKDTERELQAEYGALSADIRELSQKKQGSQ